MRTTIPFLRPDIIKASFGSCQKSVPLAPQALDEGGHSVSARAMSFRVQPRCTSLNDAALRWQGHLKGHFGLRPVEPAKGRAQSGTMNLDSYYWQWT
jgi:hypothetical protein